MATVHPAQPFDAAGAAQQLQKALHHTFGSDHKTISQIVGHHTKWQLQEIAKAYVGEFGEELEEKIKSKLSGSYGKLVELLFLNPVDLDVFELHEALHGIGHDQHTIIEILFTRDNNQIALIKAAYKAKYNEELEHHIHSKTSGSFRHILTSIVSGSRDESQHVNIEQAKTDAIALYNAGEAHWGHDESKFNQIFATRSNHQLAATFKEYAQISSKDIKQAIESELSGEVKEAFLAIFFVIESKPIFFAHHLEKALHLLGTNDKTISRVIATRAEVDLAEIKEAYKHEFQKDLDVVIQKDTGGDYEHLLLILLGF